MSRYSPEIDEEYLKDLYRAYGEGGQSVKKDKIIKRGKDQFLLKEGEMNPKENAREVFEGRDIFNKPVYTNRYGYVIDKLGSVSGEELDDISNKNKIYYDSEINSGGLYDHETDNIFIKQGMPKNDTAATVVHEKEHRKDNTTLGFLKDLISGRNTHFRNSSSYPEYDFVPEEFKNDAVFEHSEYRKRKESKYAPKTMKK